MTIDDAIQELEELRRIYGGHVPIKTVNALRMRRAIEDFEDDSITADMLEEITCFTQRELRSRYTNARYLLAEVNRPVFGTSSPLRRR